MNNVGLTFKVDDEFDTAFRTYIGGVVRDAINQATADDNSIDPEHTWMSLGETAKYLHVSRNTLRNFIFDGLKVTMIEKVSRIKRSDADSYMAHHQL